MTPFIFPSNYAIVNDGEQRNIQLFYVAKLDTKALTPIDIVHPLEPYVTDDELPELVAQANMMALKNGIPGTRVISLVPIDKEDYDNLVRSAIQEGASLLDLKLKRNTP